MRLKGYDHNSRRFGVQYQDAVTTPSEYFSFLHPEVSKRFGVPFLETKYSILDQPDRIRPVSMNIDWFAQMLGGDKSLGHDVVYYPTEELFYYHEPLRGYYCATSEEKLKTVLSQELLRCAEELQRNVDFDVLFVHLRSDEHLSKVIAKAKSIQACDDSFFYGPQGKKRSINGNVIDPAAEPPQEKFVKEHLALRKGATLLVTELVRCFDLYCAENGIPLIHRRKMRMEAYDLINNRYGLKLRKDLKDSDGKWQNGWKDLAIENQASN